MSVSRQDAWTQDEDLILAEIVLRHIREGSTQLTAFEEVGAQLSRTPAACGFRWNSVVRKQYQTGIELAKKQRKESKYNPVSAKPVNKAEELPDVAEGEAGLHLEDVLSYIISLQSRAATRSGEEGQLQSLHEQLVYLQEENKMLKEEVKELSDKLLMVEDDYRALIEIMDKARKLVISDDRANKQKVRFQMDKNGNLERVNKS
ncbi:RsfA family transcriptional regulator [Bacillus testis]|uniref:RsfA family transcriptional regulator n=1 Tax=Bacillus testis TaxID=1622072 RepID=UPI00067EA322|nr:RsfA family transcriptional regulator [Bacillus testis]